MFNLFSDLKIRTKLFSLVLILVAGFIVFVFLDYNTLNLLKVNGPLYKKIVQGKDMIADVRPPPKYIIESYLLVLKMLDETDPESVSMKKLFSESQRLRREYEERQAFWLKDLPEGELKDEMVRLSYEPARGFYKIRDEELFPMLQRGEIYNARILALQKLRPLYEKHRKHIDQVVELATARNRDIEEEARKLIGARILQSALLGLSIIALSVILCLYFIYQMTKPLLRLTQAARKISEGNLLQEDIEFKTRDEIGELSGAFENMKGALKKTLEGLKGEISERMRAEEELRSAYTELKSTESRLIQSAKMASVGQLASGVAHEINNPLTGILNNIQLIEMMFGQKKDFDLAEFKKFLDIIEECALRCKKIAQSLLDFSHISTGAFRAVSLNELVEKAVALVEYKMKLQNINIQRQLQPDLPPVMGDSLLLQQVIFDIISNAQWAIQKRSREEGGLLTIKTQYEPKEKNVELSISDTGIGIPEKNLGKIFDPFFTTKAVGEGTGLGMSIAYNTIKEHKGNIEIESQVDKGTTFKISLPFFQM